MKKKATSFKEWLVWSLRKISYKWPPRNQALRDAEVEFKTAKLGEEVGKRVRKLYECAVCGYAFSRKGVSLDHIEPVVNPKTGWQDWDEYLKRLFCPATGFQVICNKDHDAKTAKERKVRARYKTLRRNA